jgi:hypothetical protein
MKKKIIISEKQLNILLKEQEEPLYDDMYKQKIKFEFYYPQGLYFQDNEVENINDITMSVYFRINREDRSYGIESLTISNIVGPEEIEIEVDYYNGNETKTEFKKAKLDWSKIEIEPISLSYIGLSKTGKIVLESNNNEIKLKKITLFVSDCVA